MSKSILVIDDEIILTKTFARLLEKKGYEVQTASSGEEAVKIFQNKQFDLVLSDIRMPGLNGVETATQILDICKQKGGDPVALIFLTGFADKDLEEQAQKLKPIAYIYKPFDAFKLLDIIQENI